MFQKFIKEGKRLMLSEQTSVLSAATLIMFMVIAAKVLGFIRQRILFTYFSPAETDLFLAAFELPDVLFEILVFGIMSAAFIPVFSKYLAKSEKKAAWEMAVSSINIVLTLFLVLGGIVFVFAEGAYSLLAGDLFKGFLGIQGGYGPDDIATIVMLARVLLATQLFFVVSTFLTGILESHKRFLFPALAPLLYNVGIIAGIIGFSEKYGLLGPTIGAMIGAILHLAIQAPIAYHLGFKYSLGIDLKNEGVRRLFSLASPRIFELTFFQLKRFAWLFLGSLTVGGFTYLKSADLLQALPVSVFGISLSKAALPTLSLQAGQDDMKAFQKTFFTTLNQILFLVIPISVILIVLRIPVVRLVFGAAQFDWAATIQTSYTLSAFAIGTSAYAASLLVSRAFYALQDTKTPVTISVGTVIINIALGLVLVLGMGADTWGVALAYSVAGILQFLVSIVILMHRIGARYARFVVPFAKMLIAAFVSGSVMRVLLETFDRAAWLKELSFLNAVDRAKDLPLENFMIDTRYAGNLLIFTFIISVIGLVTYTVLLIFMRSKEVWAFFSFAKRIFNKKITPIPAREGEQVSPTSTETTV